MHLAVIRLKDRRRSRYVLKCLENNIGVQVHYTPVHLQPYYEKWFHRAVSQNLKIIPLTL